MVVDIALTAWLELHHEQGQVLRAKHMIHQHFQGNAKDATAPVPLHLQLAVWRHLRVVKVTKIARHWVPEVGRIACAGGTLRLEEQCIAFLARRLWLW